MSSYTNTVREYVDRYKREKNKTGAVDPHEIAVWALSAYSYLIDQSFSLALTTCSLRLDHLNLFQ